MVRIRRVLQLGVAILVTGAVSVHGQTAKDDPEILNRSRSPGAAVTNFALSSAQGLVDAGKLLEAEAAVRQYVAAHPASADGHFLLGYILFRLQKPELSLASYTTGARYRKPASFDLEVVACNYVILGDYTDADKWFTKSLEGDPSNVQVRYYLGRAKYNENRFDEAVQAFRECLRLEPGNVRARDNLGLSYQGLGRIEDAIAAFKEAIDFDGTARVKNSRPYLNLGILLVDQNRSREALEYLNKAALLDPTDAGAHRQLGKAYLHLNQLPEARTELEAAVRLDPKNGPSHFILAQVYRKLGLADKASAESDLYKQLGH